MKNTSEKIPQPRRQFLLGLTLGAAGAAAAVVTAKPAVDAVVEDAALTTTADTPGYRITPHIAHYYDTARL